MGYTEVRRTVRGQSMQDFEAKLRDCCLWFEGNDQHLKGLTRENNMTNLEISVLVVWTAVEGDRKQFEFAAVDVLLVVRMRGRPPWPSVAEV